jgi:putative addiction module component (TIGR02574 family)
VGRTVAFVSFPFIGPFDLIWQVLEGGVIGSPPGAASHLMVYSLMLHRVWLVPGKKATEMNAESLFDLSPPEKLQLVEDLWDDLASTPSEVPVHDWQKEELARRKANLRSNPSSAIAWDEVKARIRSRYGR